MEISTPSVLEIECTSEPNDENFSLTLSPIPREPPTTIVVLFEKSIFVNVFYIRLSNC